MKHKGLQDFQSAYAEDIEFADGLVKDYIVPSGQNETSYLPSTIIRWFSNIDTDTLRKRWEIIDLMGNETKNPYDAVFGTEDYNNAIDNWSGEAQNKFRQYTAGRGNGEYGLRKYVTEVTEQARAHSETADKFIQDLGARQQAFLDECNKSIKGIKAKVWDKAIAKGFEILSAGTWRDIAMSSLGSFYGAAVEEGEQAKQASDPLKSHTELMRGDSGPNINNLGRPLDATPTDELDRLKLPNPESRR